MLFSVQVLGLICLVVVMALLDKVAAVLVHKELAQLKCYALLTF